MLYEVITLSRPADALQYLGDGSGLEQIVEGALLQQLGGVGHGDMAGEADDLHVEAQLPYSGKGVSYNFV